MCEGEWSVGGLCVKVGSGWKVKSEDGRCVKVSGECRWVVYEGGW